MNTADRTFTTDKINWVKFSGAEWAPIPKVSITALTTLLKKECSLRRTSS